MIDLSDIVPADENSHDQETLNENAARVIRKALEDYDPEPNEYSIVEKMIRNLNTTGASQ